MVQYVGIHLIDSQLVLHRSPLLSSGVVYVNICELVPDFSSTQIPQSVFTVQRSLSFLCMSWDHSLSSAQCQMTGFWLLFIITNFFLGLSLG